MDKLVVFEIFPPTYSIKHSSPELKFFRKIQANSMSLPLPFKDKKKEKTFIKF